MLGAEQLKHARPHTVVINVGRGPLIDEQALIKALSDGQIRGAALDVFETEPLPQDSPLWDMKNVLLSPHNAGKRCYSISILVPMACAEATCEVPLRMQCH
jgi:phosphoglycerate dehydrogenase-like enzyme